MPDTLLDAIRSSSAQVTNPAAPGGLGLDNQTGQAQSLLAARTGKQIGAGTGGGYATSNLGEQQATQQARTQLQTQVAPAAEMQNQGLATQQAQQAQQADIQKSQISQQRQYNTLQTQVQTTALLNDMSRKKGEIDLDRDRASLDQVAQNLRLSNAKYTQQLQIAGDTARLQNSVQFKSSLEQSILGSKQELLQQELGAKSILDANDRQFQQSLSSMSVNFSYEMFRREAADDRTRSQAAGGGALVTAGVGAYGSYTNAQDKQAAADQAKQDSFKTDVALGRATGYGTNTSTPVEEEGPLS